MSAQSLEERVTALEQRLDALTRHDVREELISMRNVHGARLGAIDARLNGIEHELSEHGWIARRLDDIDTALTEIVAMLRGGDA